MVKIIFSRIGKKKQPHYRIIALDKRKDPWGDFLEILGTYNPRTKEVNLKEDRIKHWLGKGAQPSASIHNLLITNGVIKADKKTVSRISKKRTEKKNTKSKNEKKAEKSVESSDATPSEKTKPTAEDKPKEKPTEDAKTDEKPAEETK